MDWQILAGRLFPQGHAVVERECVLSGEAQVDGAPVAVIGTTHHTPIGVEIALAQAQAVLRTVRDAPGRPIVILVDTQGQRLRHRDEMLGITRYMAHLGKCIELARRCGHPVIGLVYDQALSGGFITSGLMADACHALPDATIRVMGLPAMARITKVPLERLTELAAHNPVFAPGPKNYLSMGGIDAIWDGDLAALLAQAIAEERERRVAAFPRDRRSELGFQRGGRKLALPVAQAVARAALQAPDDRLQEPAAWSAPAPPAAGKAGGDAGPA
jgi:malonate decarboxylase gamma subunit